jgi:tetratricopeptide (TPR) repeat protein
MLCDRSILCRCLLLVILSNLSGASRLLAVDYGDSSTGDDARQAEIAERFTSILEKNPRRGTALDRVYGHQVEFGTLDKFLEELRVRIKHNPNDGTAWMLLGLFESERGEDAKAVEAFRGAAQNRPSDALASYYLGQSLLLIGQPEQAVDAFEQAIAHNPPRTDLLEIFQQLGRVHQRAQRNDAALAVWNRLESLFPDDARVQEQIAITLVEEGQYALALPRYERLIKLVHDDYRRVMLQIEIAELKIRQNRRDDGLSDFEAIFNDLKPDSWLYHDVRHRIEEVFLRVGDQDSLVKYYEKWLGKHADDVDAMVRLAKFLASAARMPEATQWMEKALKLAPKRLELRRAFIEQLVDEQRFTEAISQYALLAKADPTNTDVLREWGKLVLRDKSQTLENRKVEATKIWHEIVAARPKDAVVISQVADLFRQASINDEAISLYRKAIELAPADPQYREYLGEFYHVLKRSEDALATWRAIADGSRRNAVNVARLAEVYNSFGYTEQAASEIAAACKLDAKDFNNQLKAAEYFGKADKFDEALGFVSAAERLAANDDERETVIKSRIEIFQNSHRLEEEISQLAAKVAANQAAAPQGWYILARYYEADRRWNEASNAIDRMLTLDAKSIPGLATSARISESSGDFGRAAEMNRQLAQVDRRSRSDYLMSVARLESQLGRTEEALKAGKDLIASAPGNTDNYEFYAQLCIRLGKPEEGLDALRKAVRINPTEPHLTTALGAALADQFRTGEAIEVYWRAFDRTQELDDKTSLVGRLTELHLQTNQFNKLLERLERERQADEKQREMTICLAQAYNTAGDYGMARREMEKLLSQASQDTNLLQQISKLCEQGSDLDAAIEYQRRLVQVAPGTETEYRLAGLLQSRGDRDEASELYVKLTQREEDPTRLLRSVDSLLSQGNFDSVIAVVEPRLSQQKDDWELLYREIVAWASLEKEQEAKTRCQRLLALKIPHDTLGVVAAERFKQAQKKAKSDNLRGLASPMPQRQSPFSLLGMSSQVRQAVGLDNDRFYYGGNMGPQRVWTPEVYGAARMAAFGWQLKFEADEEAKTQPAPAPEKHPDSFVNSLAKSAAEKNVERNVLYDWMYVEQLRGNYESIFRISKQLASGGGKEEQQFYLSSMRLRDVSAQRATVMRPGSQAPKKKPLNDEELELMLKCYQAVTAGEDAKNDKPAPIGGQVAYGPNGQMYVNVGGNWVQVAGGYRGSIHLGSVLEELKLAGKDGKADELLGHMLQTTQTVQELAGAQNLLFAQEKFDQLQAIYARWVIAAKEAIAKTPVISAKQPGRQQVDEPLAGQVNYLIDWMAKLGPEEENAAILKILDPALDVSIEQAKKRRAAPVRQMQGPYSQQRYYGNQLNLKYGKEQTYTNIEIPRPDAYVDQSTIMLLREVFEVFKRNDVLVDLPNHLRKRLEHAKADDQMYEQLMLGYVLWWNEEQEEALQLLTAAADRLTEDPAFRLEIASLHESANDVDGALEIVESIVPRDQKLVQQRETMALQLAERLGDTNRARQAAERLFGLRLDNEAQLALVERMRRLGLNEMAEAVVTRVQQRAGNQAGSLATLMAMYQGQGKTDLAEQMAHTILRRTTAQVSNNPRFMTSFASAGSSDGGTRAQALQLLQQTGALKGMIDRLEGQLAQSPNSPRLYEQLIEYYQASNAREKVQITLEKAIAQRPDAVMLRLQLANQLEQSGKLKEACDQYLEILRQKPALLMQDFYRIRNAFTRARRSVDLVKALQSINLQSMGQPYYVIDLVSELLQDRSGESKDVDMNLSLTFFERIFDAYPAYRNQLVSRIYNPELWKNPRVYSLAKKALVPSSTEVVNQPWFGLDSIYSYSSGGQVNAMFHQLLNGIKGTDRVAELRANIDTALKNNPGWYGGEAMLALIDLNQGQKLKAKERLEKLVSREDILKAMPSDTSWIIGQELDQFEDTRTVALKLFETAINSNQRGNMQLQYSPLSRLVKLYGTLNRKEDARQLLIKQLHSSRGAEYDVMYSTYQRVENSVWAGKQFLELGFPVDAVRLYRELIDDADAVEQAGNWYGNRPEYFASQAQNGLKKALASINSADANAAIKQLLTLNADGATDKPALDLMVSAPDTKALRSKRVESGLVTLLQTVAQDAGIKTEIESRLNEMASQRPHDFAIPVALAAYRLQLHSPQADQSLASLAALANATPLDAISAGRRPNARQRREALLRVPLWLVARDLLFSRDPAKKNAADTLAKQAIEGASRQVDTKHLVAILYEWGKLAVDNGDRPTAEQKWSELLVAATKRPERSVRPEQRLRPGGPAAPMPAPPRTGAGAHFVWPNPLSIGALRSFSPLAWVAFLESPASATTSAPSPGKEIVPPLTISQFRLATEVALAAAENGMPALSQRAVQQALAGGMPVPDPEKTPSAQRGQIIRRYSPQNSNAVSSNPYEVEVATALRKIVDKWQGEGYSPPAIYQLLMPIVLPPSRPGDILLFADTSKLRDAVVDSLGITLVEWAKRADKLTDLSEKVAVRKKNRQSLVPALVLQIQIDLASHKTDLARGHMEELTTALKTLTLPEATQLASLAAVPAAEIPELQDYAFGILELAVRPQSRTDNDRDDAPLGKLATMVNKHLAKEPEKVKRFYESYLVTRQQQYSRYGGDYGLYLQWRDWAYIANEAAKTGAAELALDYLGRVNDFHYRENSRPSITAALAITCRSLRIRDPQQRYEVWRNWTLPAAGRQFVRLLAEWTALQTAPKPFLNAATSASSSNTQVLACNLCELVDAAAAAGKLKELQDRAQDAWNHKLPNSGTLLALVLIRNADYSGAKAIISELQKTQVERLKSASSESAPELWADYLVYRACMQSPELERIYDDASDSLQAGLRKRWQANTLVQFDYDRLLRRAKNTGAKFEPGIDSGLRYWVASSPRSQAGIVPPTWLVHDQRIIHLPGPGDDTLQLTYPLSGDFSFSVDCFKSGWAEGEIGYGGVVIESRDGLSVEPLGGHDTIHRDAKLRPPGFSRAEIRVTNGRLQYFLNNHFMYEEEASPTSPWLLMYSYAPRTTAFRNVTISGNPVIPREVPLFSGKRMDGWNCTFFGESQPRFRIMSEKPKSENDSIYYDQQREPTETDWRVTDGVLAGLAKPVAADDAQSWLYYQRPLCDQETFRYEFFKAHGHSAVAPTIGRLAFLLEPQGVEMHWIGRDDWDDAVLGIPLNNRVTEASCKRGPSPLPLKEDAWNQVNITLKGDQVFLSLNGVEIYCRPLEPNNSRLFGLFRDRRQAAKVRLASLSGPWPEKFNAELNNDLLKCSAQPYDADRQLIGEFLDDTFAEHDAAAVVQRAHSLSDEQQYDLLKQWVLPSADHPQIRLYFAFLPQSLNGHNGSASPAHQGIVCPAIELVDVATRLNKLPELRDTVAKLTAKDGLSQRGQLALLAISDLRQQATESSRASLAKMCKLLGKTDRKEMPLRQRSPEFVAGWIASEQPAARYAAIDLARQLSAMEQDEKTSSNNADWQRLVHFLVGRAELALHRSGDSPASQPGTELTQWTEVTSRGSLPNDFVDSGPQWTASRGVVRHFPGGKPSWLYFQSPLKGKFEILGEVATADHRELVATYGGHAVLPKTDLKSKLLISLPQEAHDAAGELQIPNWGSVAKVRVAVDGSKAITYVNDTKIHEESLGLAPSPWLVLHAASSANSGTIQNLRLIGQPEIPSSISLIDTFNPACWRADLYGESISFDGSKDDAVWRRVGEELVGGLLEDNSVRPSEALLTYQRPLMEDGSIDFEFYFIPNESEVHPAIGKTVFLLRASGAKRRQLTRGMWETNNLLADNESAIEGAAASIPLKANDWNRVRVTLSGDQAAITVNDVEAAKLKVDESPAARFFGLYRDASQTRCRLRKLVYTGKWAQQLPALADQQLAFPSKGLADELSAGFKTTKSFDLTKSRAVAEQQGLVVQGDKSVEFSAKGATLSVGVAAAADEVGLTLNQALLSDCDVTLDFDQFETAASTKGLQDFSLRFAFDDKNAPGNLLIETGVTAAAGKPFVHATAIHPGLDDTSQTDRQLITGEKHSGRLRMVRRGPLVYCFVANQGANDYQLIATYPVGNASKSQVQILMTDDKKSTDQKPGEIVRVIAKQLVLRTP